MLTGRLRYDAFDEELHVVQPLGVLRRQLIQGGSDVRLDPSLGPESSRNVFRRGMC